MTAIEVLNHLREVAIVMVVEVAEGKETHLRIALLPGTTITPEMREEVVARQWEIITLLRAEARDLELHLQDLALLHPSEYEQRRKAAAKQLGCRLSTLDAEVYKRRPKRAAGGRGVGGLRMGMQADIDKERRLAKRDLPTPQPAPEGARISWLQRLKDYERTHRPPDPTMEYRNGKIVVSIWPGMLHEKVALVTKEEDHGLAPIGMVTYTAAEVEKLRGRNLGHEALRQVCDEKKRDV